MINLGGIVQGTWIAALHSRNMRVNPPLHAMYARVGAANPLARTVLLICYGSSLYFVMNCYILVVVIIIITTIIITITITITNNNNNNHYNNNNNNYNNNNNNYNNYIIIIIIFIIINYNGKGGYYKLALFQKLLIKIQVMSGKEASTNLSVDINFFTVPRMNSRENNCGFSMSRMIAKICS